MCEYIYKACECDEVNAKCVVLYSEDCKMLVCVCKALADSTVGYT